MLSRSQKILVGDLVESLISPLFPDEEVSNNAVNITVNTNVYLVLGFSNSKHTQAYVLSSSCRLGWCAATFLRKITF